MVIVVVKCLGCGKKKEIRKGEIQKGDQPCCDECGMPMIPDYAERS